MKPKTGCAECRKTDVRLNEYSFYNLLGQQFLVFVCYNCIQPMSTRLNEMPLGTQVSYLTYLGQRIKAV